MATIADDLVMESLGEDVPSFTAEILSKDVDGATITDSGIVRLELQEVIENYRKANKLYILVRGKMGTGKSTLANGILGAQVAEISMGVLSRGMTTTP